MVFPEGIITGLHADVFCKATLVILNPDAAIAYFIFGGVEVVGKLWFSLIIT